MGEHNFSQAIGPYRSILQILYREPWINVLKSASKEPSYKVSHHGGRTDCAVWNKFQLGLISVLNSGLRCLGDLENAFILTRHLLDGCDHCQVRSKQWHKALERAVEGIPKFSATRIKKT